MKRTVRWGYLCVTQCWIQWVNKIQGFSEANVGEISQRGNHVWMPRNIRGQINPIISSQNVTQYLLIGPVKCVRTSIRYQIWQSRKKCYASMQHLYTSLILHDILITRLCVEIAHFLSSVVSCKIFAAAARMNKMYFTPNENSCFFNK